MGSKAAQSKVSPQQQAQPTTQQPQKQQQKQPQPTQQQAAPAWLAPLQRGMGLQQANRWAEAVAAYRESLALATSFRSDGERVRSSTRQTPTWGSPCRMSTSPLRR